MEKPDDQQMELYRVLTEKSFAGIYVVQDGQFRYLNNNAALYAGYTPDELLGRPPAEIVHPEDRARAGNNARAMLLGKKSSPGEFRVMTKDGRIRWIMETITPIIWEGRPAILGNSMDVTEKKQNEATLHDRQEHFRILFEASNDAILLIEEYRFIDCNPKTLDMFQCRRNEIIGQTPARFSTPLQSDGGCSIHQAIDKMNAALTGDPQYFEWRHCRHDGTPFESEVSLNRLELSGKRLLQVIIRDISHRKRTEADLRQSEERYRAIIENIGDGYYEVDLKGNITFLNDAALRIVGLPRSEMQGVNFSNFASKEDAAAIFSVFHQVYLTGAPFRGISWRVLRSDAKEQHVEVSVSLIRDVIDRPGGFRGIIHDITDRRKDEEQIQFMAYHDPLTGLANRMLFDDRFAQVIAHARRNEERFAVMMMDLDKFKEINDRFGHDAGDQLLRGVAERLRSQMREGDTVARFGGDEFLLLMPGMSRIEDLQPLGQKVLQAFQPPFSVSGQALSVCASIGAAVYPDDGSERDSLIRKADFAMYRAKAAGGNRWIR